MDRVFQKSTENTTCELYTEMCRLLKVYVANILKRDVITAAGNDFSLLSLSDENLGIGTRTWTDLVELEAERELKPFFSAVRRFYVATIKKMLQKFPFGDSILKDLGILQPQKTASYSFDQVQRLAERFPQLGLVDETLFDQLKEEFMDFTLSQLGLPSVSEYKAADHTVKPRVAVTDCLSYIWCQLHLVGCCKLGTSLQW